MSRHRQQGLTSGPLTGRRRWVAVGAVAPLTFALVGLAAPAFGHVWGSGASTSTTAYPDEDWDWKQGGWDREDWNDKCGHTEPFRVSL